MLKKKKEPGRPPDFRRVCFGCGREQVLAAEAGLEPNQNDEARLSYHLGLLDLIWELNYYFDDGRLAAASINAETAGPAESLPYYHVLKGLLGQKYGPPYLADFKTGSLLLSGWFGANVLVMLTLEGDQLTIYYTPPIPAQGFDLLDL